MIFISYAKEDLPTARRLYTELNRVGLAPWLDAENLLPGQKWKVEIRKAIRESDYFIAVLSSAALRRGFVHRELKQALEILDEFPDSEVFVIPVRVDQCQASHDKLRDLHWVDLFPSFDAGIRKVLEVVLSGAEAQRQERNYQIAKQITQFADELVSAIRSLNNAISDHFSVVAYTINEKSSEAERKKAIENIAKFALRSEKVLAVRDAHSNLKQLLDESYNNKANKERLNEADEKRRKLAMSIRHFAEEYLRALGGSYAPTPFASMKELESYFNAISKSDSAGALAKVKELTHKMMKVVESGSLEKAEEIRRQLLFDVKRGR